MALETGTFVLALLAFLVGLPLTALYIYALTYPESKIGEKLYPPPPFSKGSEEFKLLERHMKATEELVDQVRMLPMNPPVLNLQNAELVTTVRPRRRGANYATAFPGQGLRRPGASGETSFREVHQQRARTSPQCW